MKNIIIFFLLFSTNAFCASDSSMQKEWIAKVYLGGHFLSNSNQSYFAGPQLALQRNFSKKRFWEAGLLQLNTNRYGYNYQSGDSGQNSSVHSGNIRYFSLQLAFEYGLQILHTKRIRFYTAVGLFPNIAFTDKTPKLATEFYQSQFYTGLKTCFTARLQIIVNKKCGFDLNTALLGYQFNILNEINRDPGMSSPDQNQFRTSGKIFPDFLTGRIGFYYKL